jgi:hypothetical protein
VAFGCPFWLLDWWSQFATGSQKHRDPRYPPHAFSEHGAIMAATELVRKLNELERKLQSHDQAIVGIVRTIRELMNPSTPRHRPIGFYCRSGSKVVKQGRPED